MNLICVCVNVCNAIHSIDIYAKPGIKCMGNASSTHLTIIVGINAPYLSLSMYCL